MSPEDIELYTEMHRQCQVRGLYYFFRDFLVLVLALIAVSAAAHRVFGMAGKFLVWQDPSTLKSAYWIAMVAASLIGATGLYLIYDAVVCHEIRDGLNLCGLIIPLTPCHIP